MFLCIFSDEFELTPPTVEIGAEETEMETETAGAGRKTLMEFLMCFFSFGAWCVLPIIPGLYLVNPNIPILWISVTPADWRNFWTISLALFVDTLAIFVLIM